MKTNEDDETTEAPIALPNSEVVTLSEDDKDTDEPEEKPAPTRDKDGKWTKKKETRQNAIRDNEEFRQTTSALKDQVKALEERSSRQLAELIAALRPQQQAPQVSPETAALEEQITQVGKLMKAELAKIAAGGEEDEYYKLDRKRLALIARAEGAAAGWGKQQPQQAGLPPELAARGALISQEFPGFDGHEKWSTVAGRLRSAYIAAGDPDNINTDRMAVAEAARRLGIGIRAAAPSQRTRQAYGAPVSNGRQAAGPRTMQIPRNLMAGSGLTEKQWAEALFSEDDQ